MNTLRTTTRTAVAAIALLVGATAAQARQPSAAEAHGITNKWIDGLGEKGLVFSEEMKQGELSVSHGDSAIGRITRFSFAKPGWEVAVTFKGHVNAQTPLKELQERFWHAVIDKVPTPGLDLPGWAIQLQTPTSSFEKGVEVLGFADGKIKLRVRTRFFAVYGRDPTVLIPADAPMPPGAYFQVRRDIPIDLTLEAPLPAK